MERFVGARLGLASALILLLGSCGGGGSSSTPAAPQPTNVAPTDISLSASSVKENVIGAEVGSLQTTDANTDDRFTYSLSGSDGSNFNISGSTLALGEAVSANFEGQSLYDLTITTRDSAGAIFSKDFQVDVIDQNDPPTLEVISALAVLENSEGPLIAFTASDEDDPDGFAADYSLLGEDADLFSLEKLPYCAGPVCPAVIEPGKALIFKTTPNYENPLDSGFDNLYELQLSVSDGAESVTSDLTITVTDAVEGRVVDAPLKDSDVCLDLNADAQCSEGETVYQSNEQGFYNLPNRKALVGVKPQIISIGGIDIVTGKNLANLALMAKVPADPGKNVTVTPLSTLLSISDDPDALLSALGVDEGITADDLIDLDPWWLGTESEGQAKDEISTGLGLTVEQLDSVVEKSVTLSVQIATLVQAADTAIPSTSAGGVQSVQDRALMVTASVVKQVESAWVDMVEAGGSPSLSNPELIETILVETVVDSSAEITTWIETRIESGEIDESSLDSETLAAVIDLKNESEVIAQTGLSGDALAQVTAVASTTTAVNGQISLAIASGGVEVLADTATAEALSGLVDDTLNEAADLIAGVINIEVFLENTNVAEIVGQSGGLTDIVEVFVDTGATSSGTTNGSSDGSGTTPGGTSNDSSDGSGTTSGGTSDGGSDGSGTTSGGSTDGSSDGSGTTSGGSTDGGSDGSGTTTGGTTDDSTDGSGTTSGGSTDGSSDGFGTTSGGAADGGTTSGGSTAGPSGDSGTTSGGTTDGMNDGSGQRNGSDSSNGSGSGSSSDSESGSSTGNSSDTGDGTDSDEADTDNGSGTGLGGLDNQLPVITEMSASFVIYENALDVVQVIATDAEGDDIHYSLTGADKALFSISSSGLLAFLVAPDYEDPKDSESNNIYQIEVEVSDVAPASASQGQSLKADAAPSRKATSPLQVKVINLDEGLLDLNLSTTDGTATIAPSLQVSLKLDQLTEATAVEVQTIDAGGESVWRVASSTDNVNWVVNADLADGASSGSYKIKGIRVFRRGASELDFLQAQLVDKGFLITSELYNERSDSSAPVLESIDRITVSVGEAALGKTVPVTIESTVSDGTGNVSKAYVSVVGPGGASTGVWGTLNADLTSVTFQILLDSKTGSGLYRIDEVRVIDSAGNQTLYSHADLQSLEFEHSWTYTKANSDQQAPALTDFYLLPTKEALGERTLKKIAVHLTTDDQDSPLRNLYVRLKNTEADFVEHYLLENGQAKSTTVTRASYEHIITLPSEYADGRYDVDYVLLDDAALNLSTLQQSALNALGFNTNVVFGSGNDHAPDISSAKVFSLVENTTAVGAVVASDYDGDALFFSLSGTDAAELAISRDGVLSFVSAPDYEIKESYTALVSVSDGVNKTDQTLEINVLDDGNVSPTLAANTNFAADENQLSVGVVAASDSEGAPLSFSLYGSDASFFEISDTGALSFVAAPDYEFKTTYTFFVVASDGVDETSSQVSVSIANVNEAPVINNAQDYKVLENTTGVTTIGALDPDGDELVYSLSGADAGFFAIGALTKIISFVSPPDFETPLDANGDNQYQITITAADGNGGSASRDITVAVTQDVFETITGVLIDGYLAGALVFQDLNNNGLAEPNEPQAITDILGNFSLTLQSARPDARIRVVNTGFDIGANEVLGAMLDISPRNSGVFVMTPLSTLAARMLSFNENLKKDVAEKIIADANGVDLASAPNASLFGYDPIAKLVKSTGSDAAGAQSVYAANLQLMALGNVAGVSTTYVGQKALSEIETAIQRVLDDNALTATAELKFAELTALTAEGHSGFLDGIAEHLTLHKPATDAFRLNPGALTLIDYVGGVQANEHKIYPSVSGGKLLGSLEGGALDLSNLYDLVGITKNGQAPVLKFSLNSIPTAGSSGTAVITTRILDGADATRDDGERVISAEATVDWESDGINVTVTAPPQGSLVKLIGTGGIGIQRTFRNETADVLRFTAAGVNKPASMEMKLTSYITNNVAALGIDLGTFFSAGDYYLDVAFSGLDFRNSEDANFTSVAAGFTLKDAPGAYLYIDDVITSEGAGVARAVVSLSQPAAVDVQVDYKSVANTAVTADYTNVSGTLTIKAGETNGIISVALSDDDILEGVEAFSIELSNAKNATLARQIATIRVIDNEVLVDNTLAVADAYGKSVEHIEGYLNTRLKNKLEQDTITIGGVAKSYALVLQQYGGVTNLSGWVAQYTRAKRAGSIAALKSFTRSITTQVAGLRTGEPTANSLAVGLTKLMTGVRYVDFARVQGGILVNDDGSLPTGETEETLDAAVDALVSNYRDLAADTIGDPLGNDTSTNFPSASIRILTKGDDAFTGTDSSELIATRDGDDVVSGGGGNDKLIGGAGIDIFDGGAGVDHLYGGAADDNLKGGDGDDKLVGGPGNDTLTGGKDDDYILGQSGDDQAFTGDGKDNVVMSRGTDQVTVDGAGSKTLNGGSGQDTLDINYSGVAGLSALSTSYDGDSDTLTFTTESGDVIAASNFEIFKIAGNEYSFVYNGFASSTGRNIGQASHVFVRLDGTEVFTYLPEASNCSNAGPIRVDYVNQEQWESLRTRCTNLSLGSLVQLRPSFDPNDWRANENSDEWNDLTIKVYGSEANDVISDGGGYYNFNPQGWVIATGQGDDSVTLTNYKGYYSGRDSVGLGAGDDIGILWDWSEFDDWDGGSGSDWLSFRNAYFVKFTTEEGVDCFTPGPGNESNNLYNVCGNNYKSVQLGLTYTINTGKTKNFENIVGTYNDDTLTGDSAANIILGGQGSDVIRGLDGDDVLVGGFGKTRDNGNNNYRYDNTLKLSRTLFEDWANVGQVEQLFGGAGNDVLYGSMGDDTLDGGTGSDRLHGGPGADTIILRAGDGASTVEAADVLLDFQDGSDVFGIDGLNFSNLTIEQGTDDYADAVIVRNGTEFLLVIQNVSDNNDYYCCGNQQETRTKVDVSSVTVADFPSSDPSDQNLVGTTGNDLLIGGFGNDQATTGTGVDEVYTHSGTDQVTVDGSGSKTLNGGSGQDTLDINYSGVADLSALSTSYDGDSDTLTFTTQSGDVIAASNFEIFKIAGNEYSFVYNGFASSTGRNIGQASHVFVRLDGTEVFTYLPEASNCSNAGPIRVDYVNQEQWESLRTRCTNLSLGSLVQLRPSFDPNDWRANENSDEWNDLTIKVYGSEANDVISDGGGYYNFNPQGWVIATGQGDDSVTLTNYKGYYSGRDSVGLGAGDDIGILWDWSEFDDWDGGSGSDWLSFRNAYFVKFTTEEGVDCFTPGPGNESNNLYNVCGNNYKSVQLGLTYTINTGKTKNFENIVGTYNDDTLTGDSAANIILGGQGSDVIRGLDGNDVLVGGYGKTRDNGNNNYRYDNTLKLSRTLFEDWANVGQVEQLFGGAGNDVLYGSMGDDTLDGGTGSDRLHGGPGADTIILRAGDGASTVEAADVLLDFQDGSDVFGIDGLNFSNLTIEQGTDDYADAVIVRNGTEFLLVIQNVSDNNDYYCCGNQQETRTKVDVSSVTVADFPSSDPSDQNLVGTTGNDLLIGGFGNDQATTGTGVDEVYTHSGTDQVTVDGSGSKTLNGGSGQDTLDINYSGVADLSALSTSYDGDSDTLTFTTQSGDVIAASNFEIFKIAGNEYSFVYNGFASSTGRNIGQASHVFVRLDGTEVFTYLPEASNCSNAGPIRVDYVNQEQWESLRTRCTNLSLGSLVQLRPSFDPNDWRANENSDEWNDLTIKVYGSEANDVISDGGGYYNFNPQGWVIATGQGDDSVTLTNYKGYYSGRDSVGLGAGDDIGILWDWSEFDDWDGGSGSDWLSFRNAYFVKFTTEEGVDCFTPGPGNESNNLYNVCGNNYKSVQLGLTYTINTGKTKNFENIVGTYNDDTLTGDSAANIILGGQGSDVIRGLDGDDVLVGGFGKTRDNGNNNYRYDNTLKLSRTLFEDWANVGQVEQLIGGAGNDVLYGSMGDDTLDGGTGSDRLHGGPGFDTIILRAGDGASTVEAADVLLDFQDGSDELALDGLSFSKLTIEQGADDFADAVIVRNGTEFLLVIQNVSDNNDYYCCGNQQETRTKVDVGDVTEEDFTTVD